MKAVHRLLLAAGLVNAALLSAQPASPDAPGGAPGHRGPGGPGGRGRIPPILRALDADHDGEISSAEIAGASAALRTLDTDADGTVSATELRPTRPADAPPPAEAGTRGPAGRGGPGHRPPPLFPVMLALDANGDGALQPSEISGAPASLRAIDANSDGKLTHEELRPLPPAAAK